MDNQEPQLMIRSVMLPRDTNSRGHIFGGHILSLIDLAAAQHAWMVSPKKYVTKVMKEVNFIAPVFVGDRVSFFTTTSKIGRTSISISVHVEADRISKAGELVSVTSAEVVMVAVDDSNKPIAVFEQTEKTI